MPEDFLVKTKFCENCGITIPIKISRDILRKRFCSRVCQYKYNKANNILVNPWNNPETSTMMKLRMRKPHTLTEVLLTAQKERGLKRLGQHFGGKEIDCKECGKMFYMPTSRVDGRIGANGQPQYRKYCSRECQGLALRKADDLKTDKVRLKEWAIAVKERDNYACCECGCIRRRLLQSHHKITKEDNPTLWYEITNGETLCVYCHSKRHKSSMTNFILSSLKISGLRRPYESAIV